MQLPLFFVVIFVFVLALLDFICVKYVLFHEVIRVVFCVIVMYNTVN